MAISVIIPALNAAADLPRALRVLKAGRAEGLVGEVIVADGGSTDRTRAIAEDWDCRIVRAPLGRGPQMIAGAAAASGDWLLFLHADTVLNPAWTRAAKSFLARLEAAGARAGYFRFALDDRSPAAKRLTALVAWRCRALALPYGDQGLLIPRALYDAVGGFRPMALMEDVDMARRLGWRRLTPLPVDAETSAAKWRAEGYLRRSSRNLACLALYFLGAPEPVICRLYRSGKA